MSRRNLLLDITASSGVSWSDTICNCLRSSFVSFRYCVLFPSESTVLKL